jgi:hypothetical protein
VQEFVVKWSLGFGDPTIEGWGIVVCYALGFVFCMRARIAARLHSRRDEGRFWTGLSCGLAFLAINKQLDLQILLTDIGRFVARELRIFDWRRQVQGLFLVLLVGSVGVGLSMWMWRLRNAHMAVKMGLVGALLVAGFLLARAALFNHAGVYLGENWSSQLMGRFGLEFVGIAVTSIAACWYRAAVVSVPRSPNRNPA